MSINAMYIFNGINQLNSFTQFIENDGWKIEKQLLKERVAQYNQKDYFIMMKSKFNNQKLSFWELKNEEVITWIDTMLLMRRLMVELFKKGVDADKILIIMEYPLIYGNHMRSDYLLVYDRLIIVLEFGMFNQDEKRSEERYTKKLQESINYRQIIGNLVCGHVSVVNYAMIYLPEFDRINKKVIESNIEHNSKELFLLSNFINHNVKLQESFSAINQLNIIDSSK
ncbi:MAG: hypothetical protein JXC31_03375 [Acholeplasmataceae bacterium]|nr:hypothetical protein [Acholeplasmataceae bacterium]